MAIYEITKDQIRMLGETNFSTAGVYIFEGGPFGFGLNR